MIKFYIVFIYNSFNFVKFLNDSGISPDKLIPDKYLIIYKNIFL